MVLRTLRLLNQGLTTTIDAINDVKEGDGENELNIGEISFHCNSIVTVRGLERFSTSLRRLDLSSNCLTTIHGLDSLVHLQSLNLASNQLRYLRGLESLVNLRILILAYNRIESLDDMQHAPSNTLSKLEFLDLRDNQLNTIHALRSLKSLVSLKQLLLGGPTNSNQVRFVEGFESHLHKILNDSTTVDGRIVSTMRSSTVKSIDATTPRIDYVLDRFRKRIVIPRDMHQESFGLTQVCRKHVDDASLPVDARLNTIEQCLSQLLEVSSQSLTQQHWLHSEQQKQKDFLEDRKKWVDNHHMDRELRHRRRYDDDQIDDEATLKLESNSGKREALLITHTTDNHRSIATQVVTSLVTSSVQTQPELCSTGTNPDNDVCASTKDEDDDDNKTLSLQRIEELQNRIIELESSLSDVNCKWNKDRDEWNTRIISLQTQNFTLERELEHRSSHQIELNEQLRAARSSAQSAYTQLVDDEAKSKHEINELKRCCAHVEMKNNELQRQFDELKNENRIAEEQHNAILQQFKRDQAHVDADWKQRFESSQADLQQVRQALTKQCALTADLRELLKASIVKERRSTAQLHVNEQQIESQREACFQWKERVSILETRIKETQVRANEAIRERRDAIEQSSTLLERLGKGEAIRVELREELLASRQTIEEQAKELRILTLRLEEIERDCDTLQDIELKQRNLEQRQDEIRVMQMTITDQQAHIQSLKSKLSDAQNEVSRVNKEWEKREEQLMNALEGEERVRKSGEEALTVMEEDIDALRHQVHTLEDQLKTSQNEQNHLRDERDEQLRIVDYARDEIENVKTMFDEKQRKVEAEHQIKFDEKCAELKELRDRFEHQVELHNNDRVEWSNKLNRAKHNVEESHRKVIETEGEMKLLLKQMHEQKQVATQLARMFATDIAEG